MLATLLALALVSRADAAVVCSHRLVAQYEANAARLSAAEERVARLADAGPSRRLAAATARRDRLVAVLARDEATLVGWGLRAPQRVAARE
ncbi:MAG: hypothetical protein ACOZNI_08500 [Myxococcota bacterium]